MSKLLITGSSGAIGTRLCEKLLEQGTDFVCVDKEPSDWNPELTAKTQLLDLTDSETIHKLPKDVDAIIHLAANSRVRETVDNPELAMQNGTMTFNVLEYARQNKIGKVIFASSREVYGNTMGGAPKEHEVSVSLCENPYASSKLFGETLIQSYHNCFGLDFINLRFANVYGMYDVSDRVIPLFIKLNRQNKPITVFGRGKILDYTYVDDAVNGILLSLANFETAKNATYNIASGVGTTLENLANMIRWDLEATAEITFEANRTGEVENYIGDISKAKKMLHYSPQTPLSKGIKKTIGWYRKNVKN